MKKNIFYYASVSILAGLCLSMGWYHHYIRHLTSIAPSCLSAFAPEQKDIDVHVRALSSGESEHLLGHNLPGRGIQPLHITIENNSPNAYSICPNYIDLDYVEISSIVGELHKSALPRSIAFKVLGFLFWPFMIPGTLDTIHTVHSYKSLKRDYTAKSLKDEMVPVYSTVNRILFVPEEDFKDQFTVTLMDKETQRFESFSISKADIVVMEASEEETPSDSASTEA
jgi:hypothetical protein